MAKKQVFKTFNQVTARKLCKTWQKRLRLEDWRIEVNVLRQNHMTLEGALAECSWSLERKTGTINLLDGIDSAGLVSEITGGRDMEKDLVHELVHYHFAPFTKLGKRHRESADSIAQEQAIDLIADSIVDIHRGAK